MNKRRLLTLFYSFLDHYVLHYTFEYIFVLYLQGMFSG